jgi:hypothetical protein
VSGYIDNTFSDTAFKGMGWIFLVSESFPALAVIVAITLLRKRTLSWTAIVSGLVAIFAVQMFFGGLRGSRSQTVQALFWVVGCTHLLVRPVPRKLIYVGMVFLALFMYVYGFYKDFGKDAAEVISQADERDYMSIKTGRTFDGMLLGDLGRADMQAFILYRLSQDRSDFNLAYGRTYLGAASILIPGAILENKPDTVAKEGTDVQVGPGVYVRDVASSSRVYGLAGEAMLNFGPWSVPIAYGVFGLVVGWFRRLVPRLSAGDMRLFWIPSAVYTLMSFLGGDSDNWVFGIVKDGLVPFLFVYICSQKLVGQVDAGLCNYRATV